MIMRRAWCAITDAIDFATWPEPLNSVRRPLPLPLWFGVRV